MSATITRRAFLQAAAVSTTIGAHVAFADVSNPVPARAATKGPKHHFFGYYDKCPWDKTGRYLLAMQIGFNDRQPKTGEELTIGMVDLKDDDRFIPLDKTTAWCWQQGTMLQWLGRAPRKPFKPAPDKKGDNAPLEYSPDLEVVYNSVKDKEYVAIIRHVQSGKTRTLPKPIYALSNDGKQAVTLPFDRLHRLRPGYGYCALPERFADDAAPKEYGISWMDMATGKNELVVPIASLAANKPDDRFLNAHHWVNHLQFNPSGTRFLFLHRWRLLEKPWFTRLYTCKPDGSDLRLISDTGMVSHFDWRDDDTILAWARTKANGDRFYLFDINGGEPKVVGDTILTRDGHCSYSPDRKWILNDTYPDAKRLQTLMLFNPKTNRRIDLNQFHLPTKLAGPFRCDLHPRWNRDGTQVCIDSGHEETRQMYVLDVSEFVKG
jgi:hypothetical protein